MGARSSLTLEKPHYQAIRFRISRFASIDTSKISGYIRIKRLEKGWTQVELANKLDVCETTVYNWENDKYLPSDMYKNLIRDILI